MPRVGCPCAANKESAPKAASAAPADASLRKSRRDSSFGATVKGPFMGSPVCAPPALRQGENHQALLIA